MKEKVEKIKDLLSMDNNETFKCMLNIINNNYIFENEDQHMLYEAGFEDALEYANKLINETLCN